MNKFFIIEIICKNIFYKFKANLSLNISHIIISFFKYVVTIFIYFLDTIVFSGKKLYSYCLVRFDYIVLTINRLNILLNLGHL